MKTLSRLFILLAILAIHVNTQAQTPVWQWTKGGGGSSIDRGQSIALDGSGNSYVTGWLSGNATFGGQTLISSGIEDVFVVKYDTSGNVVWAKSGGGASSDAGNSIAVDGWGNIYVIGVFRDTATFGGQTLEAEGNIDAFVVKYDTSGNVVWAKSGGGRSFDRAQGIEVDKSGNSYVTGRFQDTATFEGQVLTSSGSDDVFLVKYDMLGKVVWAKSGGGSSFDEGKDIAVDDSGNSYVTGSIQDTATFGGQALPSSNSDDVFVVKYNASGNVVWAKGGGGSSSDVGNSIVVDSSGNSYITGFFQDTAIFEGQTLISSGSRDVFIVKYDSSGKVVWAKRVGGSASDVGFSIAVDASESSYVTGSFRDTATFGGQVLTSNGSSDIFVAKFDTFGNVVWTESGGDTLNEFGIGVKADNSGNSYLTGFFEGSVTFGGDTLNSNGNFDVFVAKLGNSAPTAISSIDEVQAISIYPNPTKGQFTIQTSIAGEKELRILDATGKQLAVHRFANTQETIATEGLPAGLYILQVVQEGKVSTHRLVVE